MSRYALGIDTSNALTGPRLEQMDEEEQKRAVREAKAFSKLTPLQKTQIITLLQDQQNTVGFLGDGINDAAALRQSDIGISVDSAVDIAKESADIILLEKDLMVLEDGVLEGRKTFGNITKYIKMTASSNFGNMFSVMAASALLFAQAPQVGFFRPAPLHDFHRTHQFYFRYCHLPGVVVRIRVQLCGASDAFPVGMVHRGTAFANAYCPHDSYAQDSFHPKSCLLASHRAYAAHHGCRYHLAFHYVWWFHWIAAASIQLLPLASWHFVGLLCADAIGEKLVYQSVCKVVVAYDREYGKKVPGGWVIGRWHLSDVGARCRVGIHYRVAGGWSWRSPMGKPAACRWQPDAGGAMAVRCCCHQCIPYQ